MPARNDFATQRYSLLMGACFILLGLFEFVLYIIWGLPSFLTAFFTVIMWSMVIISLLIAFRVAISMSRRVRRRWLGFRAGVISSYATGLGFGVENLLVYLSHVVRNNDLRLDSGLISELFLILLFYVFIVVGLGAVASVFGAQIGVD